MIFWIRIVEWSNGRMVEWSDGRMVECRMVQWSSSIAVIAMNGVKKQSHLLSIPIQDS